MCGSHTIEFACLFLTEKYKVSGGSRISPRRRRQLPGGGPPTYNFAKFSQKLHEIERIWTPRGGRASKILLCRSATGSVDVIRISVDVIKMNLVSLGVIVSRPKQVSLRFSLKSNPGCVVVIVVSFLWHPFCYDHQACAAFTKIIMVVIIFSFRYHAIF